MGNFNRGFSRDNRDKPSFSSNSRGGGRDSRDSGGYRGGRDSGRPSFGGDREMHDATCSSCGKSCQVPFRPTGAKPVYCSDCFRNQNARESSPRRYEGGNDRNFEQRTSAPSERPQNNEQFDSLNAKLDKILSILENVTAEEVVEELEPELVEEVTPVKTKRSPKKK